MTDNEQLLAEYTRNKSEAAFREIVSPYLNLVYSSALRMVGGDTHRAEDVAQIVFTALAKKAGELPPKVMLGGWLHGTRVLSQPTPSAANAAGLFEKERRWK